MEILAGLLITALLVLTLWVLYSAVLVRPDCDVLVVKRESEEHVRRAARRCGAGTLLVLYEDADKKTLKKLSRHFTIHNITEEDTDGAGNT